MAACSNRFRSEQNHGYENNWEEAHNEKDHVASEYGEPPQPGAKDRGEEDHCEKDDAQDRRS
jgi:hypothetical protein